MSINENTLPYLLKSMAESHAEKPWIIADGEQYTYAEVDKLSDIMAANLIDSGVSAGDVVGVMMEDCADYLTLWCALSKIGAIEVPINTGYKGDLLIHVLTDSRASTVVISERYVDRLYEISHSIQMVKRLYIKDSNVASNSPKPEKHEFENIDINNIAKLKSKNSRKVKHTPATVDILSIMYTSGTTGPSKGVMVSHAHAFEYSKGCASVLELNKNDIYYTGGLPLFHIAGRWGVCLAAAQKGATAVIPDSFSASRFLEDVRRNNVTATFLLGVMANFLRNQPEKGDDNTTLEKVLMCPLLKDLDQFCKRFGVRVCTAYASTEVNLPIAMPLCTAVPDSQIVGKVRTQDFEIRIANENDEEVPVGEVGEILVRPRKPWTTMLGYVNHPEWTLQKWRNLWLHSGDAGKIDDEGNCYFVDRVSDSIRRRGENISSMEVESVIQQHESITECAVFPVKAEYSEEEVMVSIVVKPDAKISPEDIYKFAEQKLPAFMVPKYINIVNELPKTPTGKIQKSDLKKSGVTATTWDRDKA